MILIFESYSVSIVSMCQMFSTYTRQRRQRSHFESPFLHTPKRRITSCNQSKKNVRKPRRVFPLYLTPTLNPFQVYKNSYD